MPFSREDRRVQNSKQDKVVFLKSPPSSTSMINGTQAVAILPNKQLGYYIKQKGSLWSSYFTNDGNQLVDKNLDVGGDTTLRNNLKINGDSTINGDVTVKENKKIYFDSTDTYIYANTDDPEDLVIGSDADILLEPDTGVGVKQSSPSSDNSASAYLHIGSSSENISSLILEDNGNQWEIMSNNNLIIKDGTTGRFRIAGADGEVHICHNGGNLGIGTSAPEAQVSITSGYHVIAVEQDIRYAHSGDNTAIVELSDVKIPAKAIITRIVVVVKELSNLVTHEVNIQMSTASGVSADATDSFTELLGAGVTNTDSTDSTSASDISMGTSASDLKDVWICRDVVRNGTSDQYVYVCNAGTGNGTTNSTSGILNIIIEYYGMD